MKRVLKMDKNPCFSAKFIATQAWQWIIEQYTILNIFSISREFWSSLYQQNRHDIDGKLIIFLNYQTENQ